MPPPRPGAWDWASTCRPARDGGSVDPVCAWKMPSRRFASRSTACAARSEEHTSELQSHSDLVCRLLLEKKKQKKHSTNHKDKRSTHIKHGSHTQMRY